MEIWVTGRSRLLKLVPLESLGMVSYSHSVVTTLSQKTGSLRLIWLVKAIYAWHWGDEARGQWDGSPLAGCRGRALVADLGNEVPQKL